MKMFIELCGIPHARRKGSLLLQKLYRSTLCNFYHCHLQISLLGEASGIANIAPLENKISTVIKCSVLPVNN